MGVYRIDLTDDQEISLKKCADQKGTTVQTLFNDSLVSFVAHITGEKEMLRASKARRALFDMTRNLSAAPLEEMVKYLSQWLFIHEKDELDKQSDKGKWARFDLEERIEDFSDIEAINFLKHIDNIKKVMGKIKDGRGATIILDGPRTTEKRSKLYDLVGEHTEEQLDEFTSLLDRFFLLKKEDRLAVLRSLPILSE